MINDHSFSALDRHAVLTGCGSDDGYPWYASQMLAVEAGEVMRLRMEKFAHGDADCEQEARLMVTEKILAAFEAGASFFAGSPIASIIERYREHVASHHGPISTALLPAADIMLAAGGCYQLASRDQVEEGRL